MTIAAIREDIRKKIKRPVLPEGPTDATLVFVGEAGGETEEKLGRPFVGRAGKFLDKELEKSGFKRADVYITNVVKYRCVGVPEEKDVKKCEKWLRSELETINPKVVVLLGKTAEKYTPRLNGVAYLALPHPSAAMRFTKMRKKFEEGMEQLKLLPSCCPRQRPYS
jgi:uracil-DNA glycosylase family 4